MAVQDIHIDRKWQRRIYGPSHFLVKNNTTLKAGPAATPLTMGDLNSLGIPAINMSTNADAVRLFTKLSGIDLVNPCYWRLHWTSDSIVAADAVLWKANYKVIAPDDDAISFASMTAMSPSAGVSDTVGSTTAYKPRTTSKFTMAAGSIDEVNFVNLEFEMDTKTGLTNVYLLGAELLYYPRFAIGPSRAAGPLPTDWT